MSVVIFVTAFLAESVIATGVGLTHTDSAAKIATGLHEHRERLLMIAYLSAIYAVTFVIYLCSRYNLLRPTPWTASGTSSAVSELSRPACL